MVKKKCPAHPHSALLRLTFSHVASDTVVHSVAPMPISHTVVVLLLGQCGRLLQPANALPSSDALPPPDQSDATGCRHPPRLDPLPLQCPTISHNAQVICLHEFDEHCYQHSVRDDMGKSELVPLCLHTTFNVFHYHANLASSARLARWTL
jgi:hypothetical protein